MANKTYTFDILYTYKEEGNRAEPDKITVKSTTVGRAINKAVRELNIGEDGVSLEKDHADFIKAADLMVVDCRNVTRGFQA